MIVARVPQGLRVVLQTDHQDQCRLLANAWGGAGIARPDPWDPVLVATGLHDEGWREWESAPRVLADGYPQGFSQMDHADHTAIHTTSIAAAFRRDARVGLLVSMHGVGLSMRRLGLDGSVGGDSMRPSVANEFVRDQAVVQRNARRDVGEGAELAGWAWASYRLLQAWDLLSLYLTWTGLAGGEQWMLRRVPRCAGDDQGVTISVTPVDDVTCAVDPWPFVGDRVEAPVRARMIPDQPYENHLALRATLGSAPWQVVAYRVVPLTP